MHGSQSIGWLDSPVLRGKWMQGPNCFTTGQFGNQNYHILGVSKATHIESTRVKAHKELPKNTVLKVRMWLQYLIEQNILPCNHLSAYQCVKIFHMFLVLSLLLQPPDDLSWSQTEFSWDGEDCWDDEVVEGLQPPATAARGATSGWYATAATGWASRTTWHSMESKMEGMVKSLKKAHLFSFFWLITCAQSTDQPPSAFRQYPRPSFLGPIHCDGAAPGQGERGVERYFLPLPHLHSRWPIWARPRLLRTIL